MDGTLSHTKNPLMGWDICATAKADKGEKITRVQIMVDDFPELDKSFPAPLNSWTDTLIQQGEYPGDNTVRLIVTNDKAEDSEYEDSWSE
jgi:hypothetical protein